MNQTFYPASTTKILTALAILGNLSPSSIITKSQEAVRNVPSDSSQIGLAIGDTYTVMDGLYAVLLASDNFVCYDLALADSGSIPAFADKMNFLASTNHALYSHFVNPHGYHDEDHYTTPYDLSQIAIAAFNNPTLKKISGTLNYEFTVQNTGKKILLTHTAPLLDPNSPYYNPHVVAAKTGYHTPAGRVLVAKATYNNIDLIGVVMRTEAPLQFEDMNKLFEYGGENFKITQYLNGRRHLVNETYSVWAKPYVLKALYNGWIMHTTRNFTTPITQREFVTLLKSATPSDYCHLYKPILQHTGNSIYRENLITSRGEIALILYKLLSGLNLTYLPDDQPIEIKDLENASPKCREAILFCVKAGIMAVDSKANFHPQQPLSYESALSIASKMNDIMTRYASYSLPQNYSK